MKHYIEEEIESLYVTVLQNLKDLAKKAGQEFKKHDYDDQYYEPMRLKCGWFLNGWYWVPRNLILK